MSLEVRRATGDEIRELRLSVLRPAAERVPSAYDLMPETIHVGAFDGDRVVGCASVFPEAYEADAAAWRLRGMAVDPTYQGQGIGRLVLEATTAAAQEAGVAMLWATGRTTAIGFYQLLGWQAVGDEFAYGPAQLPHFVILRPL